MFKKYLEYRFITLYIIPFILGILSTLSFQPFNFILINLIIFPIIFYLIIFINKKSKTIYRKKPYKKHLFIFGLLFGFGFYLSGISWITKSLTFDENFKILIPFALIIIPLFLSLFFAFTILLVGPYLTLNLSSMAIFAASFAFSDYLRAKILSGFPWNLWAYSAVSINEILQIVNLIGLFSYNLFIITFFTLPIIFFFKISLVKKILSSILIIFILMGTYIFGNYEINKNKKVLNDIDKKIFVKIISPNFDLEYGLNQQEIEERFKKLIRYSEPDKRKKLYSFGQREYLVAIVLMKF